MDKVENQVKDLLGRIREFIGRYRIIIFVIIAGTMLSVMLLEISYMSNADPTADQISEAESSVKIITYDEQALNVIETFEGKDITIDAIFEPGRFDPFSD